GDVVINVVATIAIYDFYAVYCHSIVFLRSYDCFFYFAFDDIFKSGIEVASIEILIIIFNCKI
ncbi:hypothetical protein, partial [Capnocytophaga sputigena]|uniref:hypothetical protein n=1 Tax=Capnocytophaga sputigena TaxID=1019 RepID=UPI0028F0FC6E